MLHRSHYLLNLIRNTNRYHIDQLCVLQIGLIRRHASLFIIPKYGTSYKVCKFTSAQKIFINEKIDRHDNWRWIYTSRFLSDDMKIKKDKSEKILDEDSQQRIIELDKEKLGKLKERVLDIEPIIPTNKKREEIGEAVKLIEKPSTDSKKSSDDVTLKKGIILSISIYFQF